MIQLGAERVHTMGRKQGFETKLTLFVLCAFLKEAHTFLHLGFLEEPPRSFRLEEDFMHPQGFGMF